MATVPIVTEVTKAQLDALVAANGLNEGLQYYVTDKEWLLIANSNSTLLPIGKLILTTTTNTSAKLPRYIIVENFEVSIIVNGDLSKATGEPAGFTNIHDDDDSEYTNLIPFIILFDTSNLTSVNTNLLAEYDSVAQNSPTGMSNTANKIILFKDALNGNGSILISMDDLVTGSLKITARYIKI